MYKSEKVSFDKVFYGSVPVSLKVFIYLMLFNFLVVRYAGIIFKHKPGVLAALVFLSFLFFIFVFISLFMKGYKVLLGLNDKGLYNWEVGLIKWGDIKEVVIKKRGFKKKYKHIDVIIKEPSPFSFMKKLNLYFWRLSASTLHVAFEKQIDEPIEDIANTIKSYIEKYGKKELD